MHKNNQSLGLNGERRPRLRKQSISSLSGENAKFPFRPPLFVFFLLHPQPPDRHPPPRRRLPLPCPPHHRRRDPHHHRRRLLLLRSLRLLRPLRHLDRPPPEREQEEQEETVEEQEEAPEGAEGEEDGSAAARAGGEDQRLGRRRRRGERRRRLHRGLHVDHQPPRSQVRDDALLLIVELVVGGSCWGDGGADTKHPVPLGLEEMGECSRRICVREKLGLGFESWKNRQWRWGKR